MRIAIDASKAINETAGVARYTRELTKNLINLYEEDYFLVLFNYFKNRDAKNKLVDNLLHGANNAKHKIYHIPGDFKEKLLSLPISVLNPIIKNYDIYHAPEFLSFDFGLKIPQVLTVHDLTFAKFPYHLGKVLSDKYNNLQREACKRASAIVCVSKATKNDIIKYYKINPNKITVTYLGTDKIFQPVKDKQDLEKILVKKYDVVFPYILFVGTIEPRKNLVNLIKAYDEYALKNEKKSHLVIVGKKGWNSKEFDRALTNLKNKNYIHIFENISDNDLVYFYSGAQSFCYPSLYEGFGIPVLEAMSYGLPIITSNTSSLPEVGGNAAYYVNPENINKLSQAIEKISNNEILRREMSKKSLAQSKKFSFEKCAKETYDVYKKIQNLNF